MKTLAYVVAALALVTIPANAQEPQANMFLDPPAASTDFEVRQEWCGPVVSYYLMRTSDQLETLDPDERSMAEQNVFEGCVNSPQSFLEEMRVAGLLPTS